VVQDVSRDLVVARHSIDAVGADDFWTDLPSMAKKAALEGIAALAGSYQLVRAAEKIKTMLSVLDGQGQTGFWA
jgi:hypothetical protein